MNPSESMENIDPNKKAYNQSQKIKNKQILKRSSQLRPQRKLALRRFPIKILN